MWIEIAYYKDKIFLKSLTPAILFSKFFFFLDRRLLTFLVAIVALTVILSFCQAKLYDTGMHIAQDLHFDSSWSQEKNIFMTFVVKMLSSLSPCHLPERKETGHRQLKSDTDKKCHHLDGCKRM